MPVQIVNLLDKWKAAAWDFSTGHEEDKILKEKIAFIYDRLNASFPASYFVVAPREDRPLEKISWLFSLLAVGNRAGGIEALLEIAELTDYMKGLHADIQQEFKDLHANPLNLRSFFSELYIYRLLDRAGIPNEKKIQNGNQIIEGTCTLDKKKFLFECRKLYAPNLSEVDLKWRVLRNLALASQMLKHGCGMILTVNFTRPLKGQHINNFNDKIRRYFTGFNQLKSKQPIIRYEHTDDFGTLKATNYDPAVLERLLEERKYELLYYIEETDKVANNGLAAFEGKIKTNFNWSREQIYKKFKQVVREKKLQHKDSGFENKIIFLDSESFNELYFGLFSDERVFDMAEIVRIYNNLDLDCILCIIRRDYRKDKPTVDVTIIRPDSLIREADRLERMFH